MMNTIGSGEMERYGLVRSGRSYCGQATGSMKCEPVGVSFVRMASPPRLVWLVHASLIYFSFIFPRIRNRLKGGHGAHESMF